MATISLNEYTLSPEIILGKDDHRQLTVLALAGTGLSEVADSLLFELDRAHVLPDDRLPADVVRMGSRVTYRAGDEERHVELVYPARADIALGRVSVLTPIGAALIGLKTGQSITWTTRDGRKQVLTVTGVWQPTGEDGDPGPAAA
jgi:regulator of nucleoside diphosphate kinase